MDIQSKSMEPIIKKIADEFGITKDQVRRIISTEFEFVKKKMKDVDSYNNHWPQVRLANLGVFKVKDGKRKYFTEKSKKIIEDVHTQQGK